MKYDMDRSIKMYLQISIKICCRQIAKKYRWISQKKGSYQPIMRRIKTSIQPQNHHNIIHMIIMIFHTISMKM